MNTPSDFARYVGIVVGIGICCVLLFGSIWFAAQTTPLYWVIVVFTSVVLLGGLLQYQDRPVRRLMATVAGSHLLLTIVGGLVFLFDEQRIGSLWVLAPIGIFDLVAVVYQSSEFGGKP